MAYLIKILKINLKDLKTYKEWDWKKKSLETAKKKINHKLKMTVFIYSNQKNKIMTVYLII